MEIKVIKRRAQDGREFHAVSDVAHVIRSARRVLVRKVSKHVHFLAQQTCRTSARTITDSIINTVRADLDRRVHGKTNQKRANLVDWRGGLRKQAKARSIRHSRRSGVPVSFEHDVANSIRSAPTECTPRAVWEHHTVTSNGPRHEHFGALQIHVSARRNVGRRDAAIAGRRATIDRVSVVLCRDRVAVTSREDVVLGVRSIRAGVKLRVMQMRGIVVDDFPRRHVSRSRAQVMFRTRVIRIAHRHRRRDFWLDVDVRRLRKSVHRRRVQQVDGGGAASVRRVLRERSRRPPGVQQVKSLFCVDTEVLRAAHVIRTVRDLRFAPENRREQIARSSSQRRRVVQVVHPARHERSREFKLNARRRLKRSQRRDRVVIVVQRSLVRLLMIEHVAKCTRRRPRFEDDEVRAVHSRIRVKPDPRPSGARRVSHREGHQSLLSVRLVGTSIDLIFNLQRVRESRARHRRVRGPHPVEKGCRRVRHLVRRRPRRERARHHAHDARPHGRARRPSSARARRHRRHHRAHVR